MSLNASKCSIIALRWTVGLVVLIESVRMLLAHDLIHHLAHAGQAVRVLTILGGTEILGAILFLIPKTGLAGGLLLVLVFTYGVVFHLMHGQYAVGNLLVYATAVMVCLTHQRH